MGHQFWSVPKIDVYFLHWVREFKLSQSVLTYNLIDYLRMLRVKSTVQTQVMTNNSFNLNGLVRLKLYMLIIVHLVALFIDFDAYNL